MRGLFFVIGLVCLVGCQTKAPLARPSRTEAIAALTTLTQGLTYKPISEDQLQKLGQHLVKDPQAQSALRSIHTALSAQHTVKYCPVDGQRFSADMDSCPVHHVKLEWVE